MRLLLLILAVFFFFFAAAASLTAFALAFAPMCALAVFGFLGWLCFCEYQQRDDLKKFEHGASAPETDDTVSRTGVDHAASRDGGEIPIAQESRERAKRPMLSK